VKTSVVLGIGFLAALSFGVPETCFAKGAGIEAVIRIRVNNYSQASPAIMARAEREAAKIFEEAGLVLDWLDCPMEHFGGVQVAQNSCLEPLQATEIVLRVLAEPMQNRFQESVFGFAVVPIFASVYYDFAFRTARRDNDDSELPVILGSVMAHELGHLLLGLNSHSVSGVMQAKWERKQVRQATMGGLLFTHEQAAAIRVEAKKRMGARHAMLDAQRLGDADRASGVD
jgi:hypothetical protein